ncbi:hypothetical protein [Pseudomonas sp. NFACC05-1]|uniref:hypothetical protein n=1 Tax=Pseudomonas sp. NFACC05-1 TaxID=1566241 RepID=UPI00087140A2|nr:hypothetical protein [Pseudomonas sp. NFACC05-1]SCW91976.1 hypothetical protein SAMN03159424_04406 [Pseudomonas sp. NFACC05-1]
MDSVKRYHVGDAGLVEGEALGRLNVVLSADYDAAARRIGAMVCAKRQMEEELEIARDDLVIFKSGLSALGQASKGLVICARTSGGTAGPDQALMDACAGVEAVITIGGVARAMNEFERLTAENQALQARLTVQDQRVDELDAVRISLVGKVALCKACGSDDLFWYSHIQNHSTVQHNRLNTNDVTCLLILGCNNCSETLMTVKADRIAERMTAALNPTAEEESHDE